MANYMTMSSKELIKSWSIEFITTFARFSPSGMKLPKLHSWRYHVIPAIKRFGAINGFSTETYETLHKYYVKNPYRKSNKKEVMNQIINRVGYLHTFPKKTLKLTL